MSNATQASQKAFDTVNDEATMKPLQDGLFAVRVAAPVELRSMAIDEAGKYEIDFRLRQKEGEFQQAITLAHGIKIEALADDGVVVPGQPVKVNVIVANRGTGEVAIKNVKFDGFEGDAAVRDDRLHRRRLRVPGRRPRRPRRATRRRRCRCRACGRIRSRTASRRSTIPAAARVSEPYWHRKGEAGRYTFDADAPFGLPMRPTPFYVQVTLSLPGGEEVIQGLPVQHRYEGDIFSGEKRSELLVVPAFSVRVTPQVAIVPESSIRSTAGPAAGTRRAARGHAVRRQGGDEAAARPAPPRRHACQHQRRAELGAGDSRHRAERHHRRRRDVGEARAAAGLERDAGRTAGEVLADRRVADRALHASSRRRASAPASST